MHTYRDGAVYEVEKFGLRMEKPCLLAINAVPTIKGDQILYPFKNLFLKR